MNPLASRTGTNSTTSRPDDQVLDWTDLGREMWSFLTGRQAAINYRFVDMEIEVPRDTGPQAPRATWRFNGTLQVTTSDIDTAGQAAARR